MNTDPHLRIPRWVHLDFAIDTNRINAREKDADMNLLEKWVEDGVIQMEIPQAAAEECGVGTDLKKRAQKAIGYVTSITAEDNPPPDLQKVFAGWGKDQRMQELRSKIEKILFPEGVKNGNEHNDVRIVLGAGYYGRILITNDGDSKTQPGGILGRRHELAKIGVTVMRAPEAVQKVREMIAHRDTTVLLANKAGAAMPEWFGKD